MRITTAIIASIAALAPLASAAGHAKVINRCNFPVFLWSVGGSVGPRKTVQPGATFSEPIHFDPQSGGVAIKITTTPNGLFDGSPQTNFAYTLDGNIVWYDLSDVFGDAFSGSRLKLLPSVTTCPKICWPNGIPPSGSQVRNCQASSDLTLTLCAAHC